MTETQNFECRQSGCTIKTTGECLETHKNIAECPHVRFIADQPVADIDKQQNDKFSDVDHERLPFSGEEIYDDELTKLTARHPVILNLLMGDSEGGKTTLIAS